MAVVERIRSWLADWNPNEPASGHRLVGESRRRHLSIAKDDLADDRPRVRLGRREVPTSGRPIQLAPRSGSLAGLVSGLMSGRRRRRRRRGIHLAGHLSAMRIRPPVRLSWEQQLSGQSSRSASPAAAHAPRPAEIGSVPIREPINQYGLSPRSGARERRSEGSAEQVA